MLGSAICSSLLEVVGFGCEYVLRLLSWTILQIRLTRDWKQWTLCRCHNLAVYVYPYTQIHIYTHLPDISYKFTHTLVPHVQFCKHRVPLGICKLSHIHVYACTYFHVITQHNFYLLFNHIITILFLPHLSLSPFILKSCVLRWKVKKRIAT